MSTKYTVNDLGYAGEIVRESHSGGAHTLERMSVNKPKIEKLIRDLQALLAKPL